MKFFWPILLICIILCHTKPDFKKVAKVIQRKLEDNTDVPTDDGLEPQNATNATESVNDPTKTINASEARAPMVRNTSNPNAKYQIRKFYGFRQKREDVVFYFYMIFWFIDRPIGEVIKMRLRILYSLTRLRNLEEPLAQSVKSECTIIDKSKIGNTGKGEDIDYECQAPKEKDMMVSNVNLDTTVPMEIDGNQVGFDEVNFSEEAASQADNIAEATGGKEVSVYRKSSSGLSGGAIAGIVIACVVVLIAAAVAAIMLRKPSPPIENTTTVVDMKQENI